MSKPPKIVIPGMNRGAGIPAGYVVGRLAGTGQGPAQLLRLTELKQLGLATGATVAQGNSTVTSRVTSLSASVSMSLSSVTSTNVGQSTSLSQISSSLSGAISVNTGQSTSLSQISSSLSGAISSTSSLSTAVSTVISGSISTVNSRIDSLSAAGGGGGGIATVKDEGTTLGTAFTALNFTGAGVTATDAGGGVAQVDIPAGAAASSTSLSQISSSLSSEISSRISGDTSLSTVISGSISTVNSSITSLSTGLSLLISEQTGTGAEHTITFSSIPGTFRKLVLEMWGRTDENVLAAALKVFANNDTSSIYDSQRIFARPGTNSNDQHLSEAGWGASGAFISFTGTGAAAAPSGAPGWAKLEFANYTDTTFNKLMSLRTLQWNSTTTGDHYVVEGTGQYRSTSAITRLDVQIITAAKNFVSGSVFRLWGVL